MKKISFLFLMVFILFAAEHTQGQKLKDWLNSKKQEAKNKVNSKIDQKSSEGLDKAVNAPETAIAKKKEKKAAKKSSDSIDPINNQIDGTPSTGMEKKNSNVIEVPNDAPTETGKITIQTNIKCAAGKKKVVTVLKNQEGVSFVEINTANGEISLAYNTDATSYPDIVKLINDNGFVADGNPATAKKTNPCN